MLDRFLASNGDPSETQRNADGREADSDNESDSESDDDEDDDLFRKGIAHVISAADFLMTGYPYRAYKENLRAFLQPRRLEEQPFEGRRAQNLENNPEPEEKPEETSKTLGVNMLFTATGVQQRSLPSRLAHWARKKMRPHVKNGYKRIEWTCVSGHVFVSTTPFLHEN